MHIYTLYTSIHKSLSLSLSLSVLRTGQASQFRFAKSRFEGLESRDRAYLGLKVSFRSSHLPGAGPILRESVSEN